MTELQTELIENKINISQGYRVIQSVEKYCKGSEEKYANLEFYKSREQDKKTRKEDYLFEQTGSAKQ